MVAARKTYDTIFAQSTPRGKSGVAVIRISGPEAAKTFQLFGIMEEIKPRLATCKILKHTNGNPIDQAVVLYFPAPGSFTGEDTVELQVHGSHAVLRLVFDRLHTIFRLAEPGEFSLRAFLSGKIDLTKAEGISDLINAETEAQLQQALAQVSGKLEKQYEQWREILVTALAELEACIDFPEDVVMYAVMENVYGKTEQLRQVLSSYLDDDNRGERLRSGLRVVILGEPNAGKSTLFNFIAKRNAAIVSDIPGTTRDLLEVSIDISGYPFVFVDTAGIRESSDVVEREGIRLAMEAAVNADLKIVLCPCDRVHDLSRCKISALCDEETIYVLSKADGLSTYDPQQLGGRQFYPISINNESSIKSLLNVIKGRSDDSFPKGDNAFITSQRHRKHLSQALDLLSYVTREMPVELLAEHLRLAAQEIGNVTGAVCYDDILTEIFSKFCIGK
ncbi:tRNA modification GTPase MnmE [Anaplasma platys]|uniref:tRNA modification GTPase MnmE n=1 Tax=Anaplasma platys TaxID=949 RepID=A0A858PZD7_9RICK|nr:tRNA uridine-5-carboxymethylaminomethyl(34) synthesis GTPase MnmE [Anaplasma platys]QJC27927.1 tRNA modification GTPase MnmE [Anaplasma platys]